MDDEDTALTGMDRWMGGTGEASSGEDDEGDTQMADEAAGASVAPKAATVNQRLSDGVGWVDEEEAQVKPAPAAGMNYHGVIDTVQNALFE